MKLVAHKSFKKAFKRLIKKNPSLQDKVLVILDVLENDPFTPSLKSHKLKGSLSEYWSCSVTYEYRIIFTFSQDKESEETLIVYNLVTERITAIFLSGLFSIIFS